MRHARLRRFVYAFAVALLAVTLAGGPTANARDGITTEAGTVISNRAEATYYDALGTGFATVSPTISVTVRSVAALTVTPDETEPSNTVAPNERVVRLFRVCNTGNTPDFYTLTAADVSAPASLVALFLDTDASGTLTDADSLVRLGQTMTPRLARGACTGVVAQIDTNSAAVGSRISVRIHARSNVVDAVGGGAQDSGTIINAVGSGARLTSPDDSRLPPVKLVEGRERVTATFGQTLNYNILFRNSGDTTARGVVLRDELPSGLEFVTRSLKLDTRSLTDAEDADEGHFRDRRVVVRLAEVVPDQLVRVSFQARVTSSVAPGTGIVNTAVVSADNSDAASSTSAVAVINPFGLVYQGRAGGAATIPGARVALLRDASVGEALTLVADTGSTPNEHNANPFTSDAQGRWNFALAPEQLGTPVSPARYFLNVTAPGYRARMLEATLTPANDAAGLFALAVRALDGQPVAESGGFGLTESAVLTERLAAFALNVPMFENSTLEITKMVDRPSAEIGDVVTYRVEVHNATAAAVEDAVVRDTLPASFHYAEGTARVEAPPAAPRNVEPEMGQNGELLFRLGRIAPGARANLTYRVRIGANAREGEQFNTATANGRLTTGELASTSSARVPVRVRRGVFSSQQIILGRVFEDANANGMFDNGERAVAGVRLYLNNGQSVITDSAGLYTFPSVSEGAQVLSLDPVTLPAGFALADTGTRAGQSWTRLLRSPLGGGALFRQNFALRQTQSGDNASTRQRAGAANNFTPQDVAARKGTGAEKNITTAHDAGPNASDVPASPRSDTPASPAAEPRTSGTYEVASTEMLAPIAPGAVQVVSPLPDEVIANAALEIEARVNEAWTISVEVEGQRVADSKLGERRIDRKNKLASFTFVGINVQPGPNKIRVTPYGPGGAAGQPIEFVAYGRGPAKRLEILTDKAELSAGGRDRTRVRVRALDAWGHPAADSSVALEVSAGRLVRAEDGKETKAILGGASANEKGGVAGGVGVATEQATDNAGQQVVSLVGGEGTLELVAGSAPGAAEIRATTGVIDAQTTVRITPEVRPSILVGLAELSVGSNAPELSANDSDANVRSRLAFFYRGQFWGANLLTVAYDSNHPLNRTAGRDRLFQYDPLDRAYPLFGDSSTRFEDAQSNSKLYLRLDRGRSYFMFGDFETENKNAGLASYGRKLTGVKVHVENSQGDYVSVTGARPDTAFARDVFPGGAINFARLSHADILPGSETVVLEVRDRRNPEIILSREPLIRSVDYNLDASTGDIFFLRPISTFDHALNLVQVVATYEHAADAMSSAVYTARAFKTFKGAGLKVGLSFVDQQQQDFGSFVVGGVDAEKTLPRGGRLRAEVATSRGRVAISGNLFSTSGEGSDRHDGNAYRVELEQPLGFRETILRASFARADEGFLNPFGATVTPGSQRAEASIEMKVRPSSVVKFGLMDERNRTANVGNRRLTGSLLWTENIGDRLRVSAGYDFRRLNDDLGGSSTNSNLLTVGGEWQATDKLQISAKREQNLSDADPTYPSQTTLAANYQWNQFTRLFFTQRLASAPIVPIGDVSATGFAGTGSRRETAIGIETRLGRYANLNTRYQLENGINGTDSFAVIGLSNRLPINKVLALDFGYERGVHLAGEGESFNSAHLGFSWTPTENFRSSARYDLRDRGGLGTVLTLGAAGRLFDGVTMLGRLQLSRINFGGRDSSSSSATAAIAWRPLESDAAGLLFSYTRRDATQDGLEGGGTMRDRADVISSDGYWQLSKELELYGRFALKYGDTGTLELARVSSLTYMTQGRIVYRMGRYFDTAGEARWLAQPSSATRRASFGTELGFWALPDLRLGGGYNWTGAREPLGGAVNTGRRGFYFTLSSKLSNLFDLLGTPRDQAAPGAPQSGGVEKH
ncbi:MAG TPA: SdrD B-like domain-containing protein [Pyrinomonadaceae bacterium]|jgi:uncharacterized repeat protein (TIGR01451 family)|nr:SdrD B-like domain-containing protein [Pyrinomonadaceae bacterium]